MTAENTSNLFDDYYYSHGCGRPYQRDDEWLRFFGKIADRIVSDIQPQTVLDAGCAMGFLVEELHRRDVEAYGIDISEYAISNVYQDIKDFCSVGSIAEPFPSKYDLIISIEVLEHMDAAEAEQAIANFCAHTDDILFSSSPFDYKEVTHFNVHPPEEWAEMFARHGFYRDVDFDASFLTPWAVRFRRRKEPPQRIAREYERRFWLLWKENTDLRELISEMRTDMEKKDRGLEVLNQQISLRAERLSMLNLRNDELIEIKQSRGWKILQLFYKPWNFLFPQGSTREAVIMRMYELFRLGVARLRWLYNRARGFVRGKVRRRTVMSEYHYSYADWMRDFEPDEKNLEQQRESEKDLKYRPLVSFLTPIYNPPLDVLRTTIESVLTQTYSHWELCLVNGHSDQIGLTDLLDEFHQQDPRIKVQHLDENLGISGNTNKAFEMAQGEFIALLDHDDLLAPNMLYEVVGYLNEKPKADLIYFDEDKISEDGATRSKPFFKPDWSPEMLLSANYLTHPVIRKTLYKQVGELNPEMDGTQDWDLVLRCAETTQHIGHIPKILYHWRQISGSTASKLNAKSYVFDRQIQCIEQHLIREGVQKPKASFSAPGFLRVEWPTAGKKVSIVIPTQDRLQYLQKCLDSILRLTKYPYYEILIVDNNSQDVHTLQFYEKIISNPRVRLLRYQEPFNFSDANNFGAQQATGDYLLFLNNDVEVLDADWLDELVRWAELPKVGVVGAKLLYPDKTIQHAGVILGMQGHASHVFMGSTERQSSIFGSVDWYRDYMAVTGACMMLPRNIFEELGEFDPAYQLVFSDIELCVRAVENGYRVVYTPYARLIHHEGQSRGKFMPGPDLHLAAKHFHDIVRDGDPYYNPNLSYAFPTPVFARPIDEERVARMNALVERLAK